MATTRPHTRTGSLTLRHREGATKPTRPTQLTKRTRPPIQSGRQGVAPRPSR